MIIIGVSFFTTLLERYLLEINDCNAKRDHYLSTTFLAVSLFLLYMYYVESKPTIMSRIGRDDSTWIYILHPMLIIILGKISALTGKTKLYELLCPFFVVLATVLLIEVVNSIKRKIPIHK